MSGSAAPRTPRHKALLIGASEYDDPRIQDLPFVRDDLQRIRDVLADRGFQSAEIVESKRGITPNTVNGRIRSFLRDAGQGDTLLILLSGHGQHFEGKDYLIPEDATFDVGVFADSCIEIGWERELEDSPAGHVVFLVDACREGVDRDSMAALPGVQPWPRRKVADALRRKVAYVHACAAPQLALFVGEKETVRPGFDPGTQPGESFSLFSRALADTIAADPHALRLHEFARRVQLRVEELHHAYGKNRPPQRVTVVTATEATPGGEDFPLLPGPDRHTGAHPWIRAVERHPIWQLTPDGTAHRLLQETCTALAARLATAYEGAARALHGDPWHDAELAQRTHVRLGFLTRRLADGVSLSPTEAALAVLLPLVEQTFWAQEAAQRVGILGSDVCAPGPDHNRFRKFTQGFPRLKRRLLTLDHASGATGSVERIRWWLFHRWLIQQPELYAAESLKSLLGEVASAPEQPPWVADALSADRLMRLLKEHRTAPFSVRRAAHPGPRPGVGTHHEDHDVIAASTGDEHEVRTPLVSALLKAAYAMAVDPVDLPEIVVEHIGIYDSVDLDALMVTVRRSDWHSSGVGRSLNAVCTHPAVQIALREHATRVDALLREINRGDNPALAPLRALPPYADGSRVRLDGNTPDQLSDGIRFQLAEDRVQELLMGEQLYGDRELAVRELYQNALDALRYRDCRTQYLQRTHRPTAPWEGRIEFVQGVGSDGRPYLECRDNGIGMGITELGSVFSQGGTRFVDLPEYIEEQVAWSELPEPRLRLHPNSRFGIGVLSYFMLADEIVVRTCRMGRDGRPGRLLQVTIAGPGNLFRVEDLGEGIEPGTSVRLLLSRQGKRVSCLDALRRLLWVAPYRTSVVHGSREHTWVPGELSRAALEIEFSKHESRRRGRSPVCLVSGSPDLWWIDHEGIILADGLLTEPERFVFGRTVRCPYGMIVNLHGEHAPVLTVDRKTVRSYDTDHLSAVVTAALPSLTRPGLPLPTVGWLTQASRSALRYGDAVAEHAQCADLEWRLGDVSVPFGAVGYFLPDIGLLPLVTGAYPEGHQPYVAQFFRTMPSLVLRWRLRALYRAGAGGPVSLPGTDPSDEVCARPSDLLLLSRELHRRLPPWDRAYLDWQQQDGPRQHPVKVLGALFHWREPSEPLSAADVFELSLWSKHAPTEVAERMTALGYRVEPLSGCADADWDDLPLLRRAGDSSGWLVPGSTLSAVQVCVSAAWRSCSTREAAERLRELGFTVPADYPARGRWTDEERRIIGLLWSSHAEPPSPEAAPHISHAQLTSVVFETDTTVRDVTEFLSGLGFLLPADASARPDLREDDRSLLLYKGQAPWADQEVSLFYMAAVAQHLHRPVRAVAARLRELGYAVAPVPDGADQLPSSAELDLIDLGIRLDRNRPLELSRVADSARKAGFSLPEAISVFSSWGFRCSVTAEAASHVGYADVHDPVAFGPVSPDTVQAVGDQAAPSLADLGYDLVPPSEAWLRERQLEKDLLQALTTPTLSVPADPDDPPLSLVTLAVVALSTARTLREVALKATELGMRHEIEDWFAPDPL
ncbi:caspase family protein [Streptomyces sp. S.PNR 29]|uniref:HD domain-containing protein n=1 Tax=Streptomyces sp. S.PNR 29 TaxID=2973805 RepID=UPI0025AF673D|nr:caspase family protein [Streptomyces sp. S.PNR 29]MDN0194166.1 caspase family protein [Streptomyces sp. S.PNR 29]